MLRLRNGADRVSAASTRKARDAPGRRAADGAFALAKAARCLVLPHFCVCLPVLPVAHLPVAHLPVVRIRRAGGVDDPFERPGDRRGMAARPGPARRAGWQPGETPLATTRSSRSRPQLFSTSLGLCSPRAMFRAPGGLLRRRAHGLFRGSSGPEGLRCPERGRGYPAAVQRGLCCLYLRQATFARGTRGTEAIRSRPGVIAGYQCSERPWASAVFIQTSHQFGTLRLHMLALER